MAVPDRSVRHHSRDGCQPLQGSGSSPASRLMGGKANHQRFAIVIYLLTGAERLWEPPLREPPPPDCLAGGRLCVAGLLDRGVLGLTVLPRGELPRFWPPLLRGLTVAFRLLREPLPGETCRVLLRSWLGTWRRPDQTRVPLLRGCTGLIFRRLVVAVFGARRKSVLRLPVRTVGLPYLSSRAR